MNNFKTTYAWWIEYWNISDRVDYNINEKWRLYSRFSKYQTPRGLKPTFPTNTCKRLQNA